MADPDKTMQRLAAVARRETAPRVDVARKVTVRLRRRTACDPDRPLVWFAAASLATAVVVVAISAALYQNVSDPFWTIFQSGFAMLP